MAGPAAAHELIERGFEVTVFEPTALGGKARSTPSPGTAAGGR
ncbi:NAD(P)-binding protein, partial [Rhodococcus sp. Chr-9]